jgi:hypothetical protein
VLELVAILEPVAVLEPVSMSDVRIARIAGGRRDWLD